MALNIDSIPYGDRKLEGVWQHALLYWEVRVIRSFTVIDGMVRRKEVRHGLF